jgi:hypothetical protein
MKHTRVDTRQHTIARLYSQQHHAMHQHDDYILPAPVDIRPHSYWLYSSMVLAILYRLTAPSQTPDWHSFFRPHSSCWSTRVTHPFLPIKWSSWRWTLPPLLLLLPHRSLHFLRQNRTPVIPFLIRPHMVSCRYRDDVQLCTGCNRH